MERRDKNHINNYEFKESKYTNKKEKPSLEEFNNNNSKNNKENIENKYDNAYQKPKVINNKLLKEDAEIINDNEKKPENVVDPIKARINKMKLENQKLRSSVAKRNKLIIDLKDRCKEQDLMLAEIVTKIDNIKKFIPEKTIKNKQKEKFEEQLAIAAVNEQIMKEICENNDGHGVMNKLFDGDNKKNNSVKNRIDHIKQIYYKKNTFENFECSICFDEFKDNELLKQLKCTHIFHKECLSQWLLNENKCPNCNNPCF